MRNKAIRVTGFDDDENEAKYPLYTEHTQNMINHVRNVERADLVLILAHRYMQLLPTN